MLLMYLLLNDTTYCNCPCLGPSRSRIDHGPDEAQYKTSYLLKSSFCLDSRVNSRRLEKLRHQSRAATVLELELEHDFDSCDKLCTCVGL